jgi:PHD/YefM family antitoxin component YafN of YafNO toxin-antitoxin module
MRVLSISEVRRRLFDLFDEVLARGDVVVVRHRNREQRVVLTSEAYLRSLETRAEAVDRAGDATFRLFDSAVLEVDADRVLERTRQDQADRARKKRATV